MQDDPDLAARKTKLGVPDQLAGCHTALIGSYVIEGHVPPDVIILFLAQKPVALGLAVPGMRAIAVRPASFRQRNRRLLATPCLPATDDTEADFVSSSARWRSSSD